MIGVRSIVFSFGLAAAAAAQAPQVAISIGIRETGFAGGPFSSIGGNGGAAGGIEWVNLDGQTLILDGTWQQFTFTPALDPLTQFAGTSANGVLDGSYGTLEHVRVLNTSGTTDPISIWIDDVTDTTTTGGAVNFANFEGYATGIEVMFQEPSFSGSTSANVLLGSTSGIDNRVASRSASCRFDFQFVDGMSTRWVRLTTFNTGNQPNPLIRFDDNSVVTFWLRGGECQPDLGSQGPGTAFAEWCGTGLNILESSTYFVAGAPANAPGALAISFDGFPDLPLLGGNLVSGTGLAVTIPIAADALGKFSFLVAGDPTVIDLDLQSVLLDFSLPQSIAFTNAIKGRFGQ